MNHSDSQFPHDDSPLLSRPQQPVKLPQTFNHNDSPPPNRQIEEPPSPARSEKQQTLPSQALANSLYELGLVRNPKPSRYKQQQQQQQHQHQHQHHGRRDDHLQNKSTNANEESEKIPHDDEILQRKIKKYNRELHDIPASRIDCFEEDISVFTKENSRAICYFARFLKDLCSCTRDLGFYQECSSYITKSELNTPKKMRPKAQALMKKYIEGNAPKQVQLLPTIQKTVIRNFYLRKDKELLDVLYIARADILRYLRTQFFPSFLKSDCYLSYLKKEVRDKRERLMEQKKKGNGFKSSNLHRRLSHPIGHGVGSLNENVKNSSSSSSPPPFHRSAVSADANPKSAMPKVNAIGRNNNNNNSKARSGSVGAETSLLQSIQPNYFMASRTAAASAASSASNIPTGNNPYGLSQPPNPHDRDM